MGPAVVASRKRGADAFLGAGDPFDLPRLMKRGRCSASAAAADLSFPLESDPVEALQLIFPGADPQILRDHLQASGNVLDAAIRAFKDYLADRSTESASALTYAPSDSGANDAVPSEVDLPLSTIPTNGSEWAELIVKEMSSASDLVDAKNRAFKILKILENSAARASPDEKHKVNKHNRLKEYQEMVEERSQFNQILENYQKQIKALEEKNYALSFHLQQVNQCSNTYGYRNPDVC
ncbi:hypothetical protein PVAP13_4KG336200 [Panicum virgatum]|uniref:CUE domain-containing protein n=1 Tax=Panicum virgatum TaxID=38727 RepID=A0A8T0TVA5_PANVG|nr:hypothetical protein PVAP13_4KG336200 [Panicum virgatum]